MKCEVCDSECVEVSVRGYIDYVCPEECGVYIQQELSFELDPKYEFFQNQIQIETYFKMATEPYA